MERKYDLNDLVENLNVRGNLKDNEYLKYIQSYDLIDQLCMNQSPLFLYFLMLIK